MPCVGEILERLAESVLHAPVGVLRPPGKAHAAEQDIAKLLGRADVEALAGELVDLFLDLGACCANSSDSRASTSRSTSTPSFSIRASTGTSGRSSVS